MDSRKGGREEGPGCQPPEVAQLLNEYTTDGKVAVLPLPILALLGVISQLTLPSCDRYINPWLKRLPCPFLSQT